MKESKLSTEAEIPHTEEADLLEYVLTRQLDHQRVWWQEIW